MVGGTIGGKAGGLAKAKQPNMITLTGNKHKGVVVASISHGSGRAIFTFESKNQALVGHSVSKGNPTLHDPQLCATCIECVQSGKPEDAQPEIRCKVPGPDTVAMQFLEDKGLPTQW